MKCGKLTAKLRDAVQVRFYENGREIKRYKNIEIPDTIKELEYTGFKFDVPDNGPITFKIFFAPGTLPETWPEARQRKTRMPKGIDEAMAEDTAHDAVEMPQDASGPQAEGIWQRTDTRPSKATITARHNAGCGCRNNECLLFYGQIAEADAIMIQGYYIIWGGSKLYDYQKRI